MILWNVETRTVNEDGGFDRTVETMSGPEMRATIGEVARFHRAESTSRVLIQRFKGVWIGLTVWTVGDMMLEDFCTITASAFEADGDDDPMCFRCGRVPRVPDMMLCESCESEEPKGDK